MNGSATGRLIARGVRSVTRTVERDVRARLIVSRPDGSGIVPVSLKPQPPVRPGEPVAARAEDELRPWTARGAPP
ncbi:hypothetical protein [Actinocorallia longicatena]|uniref:Uncharacterized protein n=1 Tax=Actinocorallia longicatena TaxID=111803 RepID=A0ABP6PZQ3_9ACTN